MLEIFIFFQKVNVKLGHTVIAHANTSNDIKIPFSYFFRKSWGACYTCPMPIERNNDKSKAMKYV